MKTSKSALTFLFFVLMVVFLVPALGQETQANSTLPNAIMDQKEIGFLATFVRTPFILFCFVGTITGVIFSAIIEFLVNLFSGFGKGYPNTNLIWELGWNQLIRNWYWSPSVWWHALISIIIWSPLLKRKKRKE